MKKVIILAITCLIQFSVVAQLNTIDDLILYNSNFEKDLFLTNDKKDELDYLLAITKGIDADEIQKIKSILSLFIQSLEKDIIKIKSDTKRIKFIQSKLRNRFLKSYKPVSEFYNIFKIGEYNCVSSTALLAYVLKSYDIPYTIKELPTHVYLIAYPKTTGIIVQTTATKNATSTTKESTIKKSVDFLIANKLIKKKVTSKEEYRQAYYNYFFTDKSIDLFELAALQYFNESLDYYDNENFLESLSSIQKAFRIYPSKLISYIRFQTLIRLLEKNEKNNLDKIILLSEYTNVEFSNKDAVVNDWNSIVYNELLKNDRKAFIDSAYTILKNTISSTEVKKEIDVSFFLGYSDYYENNFNRKKSFEYGKLAFETDTNSTFTQSNFASKIFESLGKYIFDLEDEGSKEELADTIDYYRSKYTFLQTNNLYLALTFYTYSQLSSSYFFDNDDEFGSKYFDLAIKAVDLVEDKSIIDDYYYGMLYAEAGAYYYRQKIYLKAKEIILEGLKIIPEHERLLIRLEIIESKIDN